MQKLSAWPLHVMKCMYVSERGFTHTQPNLEPDYPQSLHCTLESRSKLLQAQRLTQKTCMTCKGQLCSADVDLQGLFPGAAGSIQVPALEP